MRIPCIYIFQFFKTFFIDLISKQIDSNKLEQNSLKKVEVTFSYNEDLMSQMLNLMKYTNKFILNLHNINVRCKKSKPISNFIENKQKHKKYISGTAILIYPKLSNILFF